MSDLNPYSPPEREDDHPRNRNAPPVKRQLWPRIFGIVSCVFAGQAILITPLVMWFNRANATSRKVMDLFPAWHTRLTNYSMVLGMALGAMLLVAGLKTMKRQQTGKTLHMLFATISLLSVLVSAVAYCHAQSHVDTSGLTGAERAGIMGGSVGGILGSLFGAAYPIFLLVWFTRPKIQRDIEQWEE